MSEKDKVIQKISEFYQINDREIDNLDKFIDLLIEYNKKINLIGGSTIENIWERHILDSAQLLSFIDNKNINCADIGSGAGFPGLILSILGVKNIDLIEKSFRKSEFLLEAKKISPNEINVVQKNIYDLSNIKYDTIFSRALAPLDKLLTMSDKLLGKNGRLIFLKGKNLESELSNAKKNSFLDKFNYEIFPSISSDEGNIIILNKK